MHYQFEWDPEKANKNSRKHSVSFEEAATVFKDRNMRSIFDSDHSKEEDRWITLGISSKGRVLVVCHTFVEESQGSAVIRIFSSRKATNHEIQQYWR
ncbi:MAG: BrnT family toxin [Planctomycetota bacterium]